LATNPRLPAILALVLTALTLGACGHNPGGFGPTAQLSDRECLARVMFFESNRSSDEGMLAVGTVVMNRLQSPKYPKSVCGVVGQQNQFADGALTNHVNKRHSSWARAERAADAVLAGERHAGVGQAMFFHTAGYSYPYRNMKYVTLAGGNMFYDKRYPTPGAPAWPSSSMFAKAYTAPGRNEASEPVMVAEAKPIRAPRAEPIVVAARAQATPSRPVVLASSAPAKRVPAFNPAQIASIVAKPAPFKPKAVQVASIQAPAKPIRLAMLETKPRAGSISITDLIERDVRKR
jgi:spore germination cell wall hydrolase CwlJ-like protein